MNKAERALIGEAIELIHRKDNYDAGMRLLCSLRDGYSLKPNASEMFVLQHPPEGVCIRGRWVWLSEGRTVTRAVNVLLKKKKLMQAQYYMGGRAGAWPNEAGRAYLEDGKQC